MDRLTSYAHLLSTSSCFNTIIEIKKAIREKDEATAFMALGELREQISMLDHYFRSLEEPTANSAEQAPTV